MPSRNTGELPSALGEFERVVQEFAGRKPVLFLDYDGTLTPIVERPEDALLSNDMRSVLSRLTDTLPVAVVSGRDVSFVRTQVALDGIVYAGSHGFDIVGPVSLSPEAVRRFDSFVSAIDSAESQLRNRLAEIPGARVERKKYSVAAHYRQVDESRAPEVASIVDDVVSAHPGLKKGLGKKVFEVRPDIDWDKGRAVLWLFEAMGYDIQSHVPLYIGDDVTDEDAFRALADCGVGIVVAASERPTEARYRLKDTDEVREFLHRLARSAAGEEQA
ncbi:MAG: hypothetical protein Kow0056_03030 [Coriobacteriia bacterium]